MRRWCIKHVYAVIFMFMWVLVHTNTSSASKCIEREREALLAIKKDLVDHYKRLSSWVSSGGDCCKWEGIYCDSLTGHVLTLDLANPWIPAADNKPLQGTLSPKLIELRNLTYLDLRNNKIQGDQDTVSFIGALTNLRYLDLSTNYFCDGQIIYKLENLTHLEYLNLAYLSCSGDAPVKNPDSLPNHRSLRYLDLSYHNLSRVSDWLEIVNKLLNLRNLTLDECDLPSPNLSYTNTSSNKSPLASVSLSNNPAIDSSSIFKWLFNYNTTLVDLRLSYIYLTLIPDVTFRYMTSLAYLDLSYNEFSDPIPEDLFRNTTSLAYLDLSYNNLSGPIPPNVFRNTTSLAYLDLSDNKLSGSIPEDLFRNTTSLAYLFLSYNNLSGPIPPNVFRNTTSLAYLDLSDNKLSGSIPEDLFRNTTSLAYLFLSYNNLSGPIPPNVFRNTTSLAYLDLSDNKLSGSIPDAFGNMSLLRHLDLSKNLLDGVIPQSIGQITHPHPLEILDLSYNSLVGPMPDVTNLLSLNYLYLHGNNLSGRLPEIIGQLSSSLEALDLGGNQLLSGRIPESIGNLSSLMWLGLSDNRLSGRLPESIGQLFNLHYLNLSVNSLQGLVSEVHFSNLSKLIRLDLADNNGLDFDVHSDWNPPFQLLFLNLRSCKLGPDFPKWLATQEDCHVLDVSHAGISCVLPKNFWSVFGSFAAIDFSHNEIKGTFGNSTVELEVREVHFSSNQMEGQIPSILSEVSYLDLSNNTFSEISSFLCSPNPKVKVLKYLDLSNNHVLEELPNCWTHLVNLQLLDLSNNEFFGAIPDSIGSLFRMETLKLRSNRLVGELPSSLKNCTSLRVIDLADNKFSSLVPEWIGASFPSLVILLLQSNQFSGNLTPQLCQLKHIQILDLSGNEISGTIPNCLDGLTALAEQRNSNLTIQHDLQFYFSHGKRYLPSGSRYYEDEVTFIWKGSMFEFKNTLGLVKRIDFSSNRLTGKIPSEVTRLVGLISLNMSRNNLTGHIPPDIGMLESLDALDLSINQIGGEIPTSLGQIHRLGYLDLSNNSLSGEIPTGTQLQGFDPSVFSGNPHLCGLPLPNMCASEKTTNQDDQEDTDKFITEGFYITLAFGFVVGFWGVCGSLILKRKWRYAYYRFLNALNDWFYVKMTLIKRQFKDRCA